MSSSLFPIVGRVADGRVGEQVASPEVRVVDVEVVGAKTQTRWSPKQPVDLTARRHREADVDEEENGDDGKQRPDAFVEALRRGWRRRLFLRDVWSMFVLIIMQKNFCITLLHCYIVTMSLFMCYTLCVNGNDYYNQIRISLALIWYQTWPDLTTFCHKTDKNINVI